MKYLTQSNTSPGNCWQTAIACILDVEPDSLPDQLVYDVDPSPKALGGWGRYSNVLNGYLGKHFGLIYTEIPRHQFGAIATLREDLPTAGYHLLTGTTVRTPTSGIHHVVVGRHGEVVWDPHPSRDGLVDVLEWGIFAPLPQSIAEQRRRQMETTPALALVFGCLCPACRPG